MTLVVLAPVYVIQDLYELGLLGEVLSLIARIHELCDFTLHNAEFIAGMLTGLSGGIPSGSGGPPPAPGPVPGAGASLPRRPAAVASQLSLQPTYRPSRLLPRAGVPPSPEPPTP